MAGCMHLNVHFRRILLTTLATDRMPTAKPTVGEAGPQVPLDLLTV